MNRSIIKIGIVGPESTGKSDLATYLANHFNTQFVPEVARDYLNNLGRNYNYDDLLEIAKLQVAAEEKLSTENNILICDTTLLVIKIWSEVKFQKVDSNIQLEEKNRYYDLYLLTNIDLPWEPDPLREHPDKRQYLFDLYHQQLTEKKCAFEIISGQGKQRNLNALKVLKDYFPILKSDY
jgi:nicotinamide riboside kinase